jgi:hypothetical protein
VSQEEAKGILEEIHEGSCGSHIGARSLAGKIRRTGFYWPELHRDAARYVQTCDKCQRFANLHYAPGEPLKSVLSPWPFFMWCTDILGPFTSSTGQAKWIIVAIDYFTKWVEAEALSSISAESAKKVILRAIKRKITSKGEGWVAHLLPILWSYHTTPQSSIGEAPFTMVYGTDAMIPT